MDEQELAFLNVALSVGDPRIERRRLVGFYVLRECCRLEEDEAWTPRLAFARRELDAVAKEYPDDDRELRALKELLGILDTERIDRPALYSALVRYGRELQREGWDDFAPMVFEVAERSWTSDCLATDRLELTYCHCMAVVRGAYAKHVKEEMPIVLAQRARMARSREYLGAARVIELDRLLFAGNLSRGLRDAERLLAWIGRHPSTKVEAATLVRIATVHGRAGRFEETVRYANRVLDTRFDAYARYSGLHLAGMAFMDLGDYAAAEAAFQLLLLAPNGVNRFLGWIGLLDLYARRGEREKFERIFERLAHLPFFAVARLNAFQAAGRGWAMLGETERARVAFNTAHAIAEEYGYNYEIIETDDLLGSLDSAAAPPPIFPGDGIVPDAAAQVTAMRDAQAVEIAECLA